MELILVFMTASGIEEADRIAVAILERRLAACVTRLPGAVSRYWWEGAMEESEEVVLLAKTRSALLEALRSAVREVHSYEVFELIAVPITGGDARYLRWVEEMTDAGCAATSDI